VTKGPLAKATSGSRIRKISQCTRSLSRSTSSSHSTTDTFPSSPRPRCKVLPECLVPHLLPPPFRSRPAVEYSHNSADGLPHVVRSLFRSPLLLVVTYSDFPYFTFIRLTGFKSYVHVGRTRSPNIKQGPTFLHFLSVTNSAPLRTPLQGKPAA
jgi:hypothetical protein